MQITQSLCLSMAAVVLLTACASEFTQQGTVLRYENKLVAQARAATAQEAETMVINTANAYCKKNGGGEVIASDQQTRYSSAMDGALSNTLNRPSDYVSYMGVLLDDKPFVSKLTFSCR